MISKALELLAEGGRVSHSWCMCVVDHGYGGLGWGKDGGGGLYACRKKANGDDRMLGDTGALPECEVKIQMTPHHTVFQILSSG